MAKDAVKWRLDTKKLDSMTKKLLSNPDHQWVIHDSVEYGVYVEFGTSRRAARPALRPAFEMVTQDINKAIKDAFEKEMPIGDVVGKMAFDIQRFWASTVPVDTGAYRNGIIAKPAKEFSGG